MDVEEWKRIDFAGVVQGVGFRPALYRVATAMGIDGSVANTPSGAITMLKADDATVSALVERLRRELPPMASIDSVTVSPAPNAPRVTGFHILPSGRDRHGVAARVSPDVAICPKCLADMTSQPRRNGYFLTNCTDCGPRFSIIKGVPYDRPATTMSVFDMCPDCRAEYTDPADRRFHAQPIACHNCGPAYTMTDSDGDIHKDPTDIVDATAAALQMGEIVVVKGIGGYNLIADALNEDAVSRLRALKHRPRKPFAVMAANLEEARSIVQIDDAEAAALTHWRAPIVVCRQSDNTLAQSVAPGCCTLGVMLPYMGFHHALMTHPGVGPIIVTSANRPGCPIIADDDDAASYAAEHHLAIVSHPRAIANRCDDSVVRIIDSVPRLLRRSRGYVPEPLGADISVDGIAAMGADITSTWALGSGSEIIPGQYIGALESVETIDFLHESVNNMERIFGFTPQLVVTDAHPAYCSAAIGKEYAAQHGAETIAMWHHHAHAVSVMAEYGISSPVLAIVLDGTGAGPDNTVWGSELLACTRTSFERIAHGQYFPLPGGDMASRQPWRMALSVLITLFGSLERLPAALTHAVGAEQVRIVEQMVRKGLRSPLGCGAGRVWDAVSALCGLAYTNGYESEAPILLENAAVGYENETAYPINAANPLDLTPIFIGILDDIDSGVPAGAIAARFHKAYATGWVEETLRHARRLGMTTVVLGGGVFQNALLERLVASGLKAAGVTVLSPLRLPAGDGGIAAGQILYGAEILRQRQHA